MISNEGFTLVEILIVVIILGILAAIVIPQFTEASNDARESALASDLQTIRSQVELYKIQHLDLLPGDDGSDTGTIVAADFVKDLTEQTGQDGLPGTTFGPYLQSFPSNPFVGDPLTTNTIVVGPGEPLGTGNSGWWLNSTNRKVSPDDNQGHETL